ncbi:MAG: LysM peptidoglycan-binding domain-containing protein [bacterium]
MRVSKRLNWAAGLVATASALLVCGVAFAQAPSAPPRGPQMQRVIVQPAPQEQPRPNTYDHVGEGPIDGPRLGIVGSSTVPVYHTVRRGDTLWGLCGSYFRNPWHWPKVWSYNPTITNPHWIYPGNRVRLRKGKERAVTRAQPPLMAYGKQPQPPSTIYLRQRGFLEEDELKYTAKIIGSREEKIMLATFDQVYVKYTAKKPLKVGERYHVYKIIKTVVHPHNKRKIGKMVEVFGTLEIKTLGKAKVARGVILRAVNPMERGYLVGKLKRVFRAVKPVKNTRTRVAGTVLAVLGENHLIGTKQLVFIDRGKKFKVKVGYTFYVTRRGDSYRAISQFEQKPRRSERKWPRQLIAQIVVVDVGWNHSVGFVAKALQEVRLGDRVELLVDSDK